MDPVDHAQGQPYSNLSILWSTLQVSQSPTPLQWVQLITSDTDTAHIGDTDVQKVT